MNFFSTMTACLTGYAEILQTQPTSTLPPNTIILQFTQNDDLAGSGKNRFDFHYCNWGDIFSPAIAVP